MGEWLYGDTGYYSKYKEIGKKGDFYTAVSSSQFFGGSIANEIIKMIEIGRFSERVTVCEIGAHKGYLISDIIQFIYTLKPELLKTLSFAIIERFDHLQKSQKEYIYQSFGDEVEIEFSSSLADFRSDETIFIANEIFDAFPCELIYNEKVGEVQNHKIEFSKEDSKILEIAKRYHQKKGEIAVGYDQFAREMVESSKKFEFITFDYGDISARPDFSIRVYQKHNVFPLFEDGLNLEELYQTTDITFDVNFAHLRDEFIEAGAEFVEFQTQMRALVDFGLIELLQLLRKNVDDKTYNSEMNRAKVLIDPAFLGERFKMIRFRKV